ETMVMTRAVPVTAVDASGVTVSAETTPEWRRGRSDDEVALLTRHDHLGFASGAVDGQVVAVARGVLEDGWLGISSVRVDPAFRRQGWATKLLTALSSWAGADAQRCYLQVEADNIGALALYSGLGFTEHHRYHYRRDPDSTRRSARPSASATEAVRNTATTPATNPTIIRA
ncbi:MAG: acetyltransferase, partial [Pseudonocardiales bacterium]|nr:acetyltransferase [Pseudonocardiales bacterium]